MGYRLLFVVDLLIGVLAVEVVVSVLLGATFGALSAGATGRRSHRIFAALCVSAAAFAVFTAWHFSTFDPAMGIAIVPFRAGAAALSLTLLALLADATLRPAESSPAFRRTVYSLGGVAALLGVLTGFAARETHVRTLRFAGRPLPAHGLPTSGFTVAYGIAMGALVAMALWPCIAARRSNVRRRHAVIVAVSVVAAAAIHDVVINIVHLDMLDVGPHAFFAFASAMAFVLVANVVQDLTEHRARVAQLAETLHSVRSTLEQRQQLAAVGELSAIVAHEMRNPLAVITNAMGTLARPGTPVGQREMLMRIVVEETDRMNRIVGELLSLARPIALQRRRIDLRETFEPVLARVRSAGFTAKLRFAEGTDESIVADGHLLRQVFDNLADNAMQAMGASGELAIEVGARVHEANDGFEIAVSDTGEGMNTEVRSRARDPFFTTRHGGTGLGLAIVDRLVRAHAGHLEIDSSHNAGTTIRIWLPALRASDSGSYTTATADAASHA